MKPLLKNLGYAVLVTMLGVYLFLEMTGPRGIPTLMGKQRRIGELTEDCARIEGRNQRLSVRVQELKNSREERANEIRRRYRLQREGTIDFYKTPPNTAPAEPPR